VRNRGSGFQPEKMLLVWAAFIFFFFSVSSSKLPSYILPIFPAIALLIACTLRNVTQRALAINAGILIAIGVAGLATFNRIPPMAKSAFELPLYTAYAPWVAAAAAIAVVGGALAFFARRHTERSVLVIALTGYLAGQCVMLGHDPLGRFAAGIDLVPAVQAEMTPQTHMYMVNRYEQALPFYLERTMTLVAHADEMEFGLSQQPELWIPDLEVFVAQWTARFGTSAHEIAIIHPDTYRDLKQRDMPMRVIASDPRRVIVSNQPQP
jgi:4-amino-4-deoxy-L-arabinose transferase-like glycosyltransferase